MIWFSSDHHFGHRNCIIYDQRPFNSVEEMDFYLIKRWNEKVHPEDTVYYLGDFSLSKDPILNFLPYLNGEKHLICGNHDHPHPVRSKKPDKRKRMADLYLESGFKSIELESRIDINGTPVRLHHMPYRYTRDHAITERYSDFRPVISEERDWLLHGHVHTHWKQKGRMINVGCMHWDWAPVSIDQISVLIDRGPANRE